MNPVLKEGVEPEPLRNVRSWVRGNVPGNMGNTDRRGFSLLEWEPIRGNDAGKLTQLSLEHEVRLKPPNVRNLQNLQNGLHANEGKRSGEGFLPDESEFADLVIRRFKREFGSQSRDRYYDVSEPGNPLIPLMYTVRERTKTRNFMTWGSGIDSQRPMNLELPFVQIGESGLIARLEFNWIDSPAKTIEEVKPGGGDKDALLRNPLYIASVCNRVKISELSPVLEHTTFREKFSFDRMIGQGESEIAFVLNVDYIVVQSLKNGRFGAFLDVDISSVKVIDESELSKLSEFARAVSIKYGLMQNYATKAFRGGEAVGMVGGE